MKQVSIHLKMKGEPNLSLVKNQANKLILCVFHFTWTSKSLFSTSVYM